MLQNLQKFEPTKRSLTNLPYEVLMYLSSNDRISDSIKPQQLEAECIATSEATYGDS
jgi:hypothetical protein